MTRTTNATLAAIGLGITLAGCGGGDDSIEFRVALQVGNERTYYQAALAELGARGIEPAAVLCGIEDFAKLPPGAAPSVPGGYYTRVAYLYVLGGTDADRASAIPGFERVTDVYRSAHSDPRDCRSVNTYDGPIVPG